LARDSRPEIHVMKHVQGWFRTREAAELATEHLVQEYSIDRSDIFIEPAGEANSIGEQASGGDAGSRHPGTPRRLDGALGEAIELSVDVDDGEVGQVQAELEKAGAVRLEAS
jgi:hypothetical protein